MQMIEKTFLTLAIGLTVAAVIVTWSQHERSVRFESVTRAKQQQAASIHAQTLDVGRRSAELRRELDQLGKVGATNTSSKTPPTPVKKDVAMLKQEREAAFAEAFRRQRVAQLVNGERYLRPKFEQIGLSAAQWEAYKRLGLDLLDARQKAMAQGIQGESLKQALADANRDYESRVKDLIGPEAYGALQAYQQRSGRAEGPAGIAIRDLSAALLFSEMPLQPQQAERLETLFEAERGRARFPVLAPAVAEQALQFLSPTQMVAWRRIQDMYRREQQVDDINAKSRSN